MSTVPILPEHEESKEPPTNPEDPSISKATATAFEKENKISEDLRYWARTKDYRVK